MVYSGGSTIVTAGYNEGVSGGPEGATVASALIIIIIMLLEFQVAVHRTPL